MTISKAGLLFFEKFNCGISHGSISTILKQNHLSYTKPLKESTKITVLSYNFEIFSLLKRESMNYTKKELKSQTLTSQMT